MADYQWQLDDLYPSYESEAFKQDWQTLQGLGAEFEKLELDDTVEAVAELITFLEKLNVLSHRLGAYIRLKLSTDTLDVESSNYQVKFSQIQSQLTKVRTQASKFLANVQTDLSQHPVLSEYEYLFKQYRLEDAHRLSEEIESILSKMNMSGGGAWSKLQSYLTATVEGELNGKKYTLSELRNMAMSSDATLRRQAYEAELKLYDQIKDAIAFAINNIKLEVHTVTQLRGYDSPLDATLQLSRMSEDTLHSLIEAIEGALPIFRRYLKLKAKYLGHDNGLPFYDLFAPMGEMGQTYSVEEAEEFLIDRFEPFSADLADLVRTFAANDYIDFLPRKGKTGGAFCSNLPFINQSRIMMNFDGSLSSVVTLAHELGHAYHGSVIQEHRPLNWRYTMPLAETASTFNETIVMNSLFERYKDQPQTRLALLDALLQDTTQIIVDIYSRFYFERHLFDATQDQFLFSPQLEALMLEAQKAAYGDGLAQDALHPFMWVNKSHYYSTGLSYYNFPYAFGGLFARGLYDLYQAQPEGFVEKYHEMLKMTTKADVEEVGAIMGIDMHQVDFWRDTLQSFETIVDEFESLLESK